MLNKLIKNIVIAPIAVYRYFISPLLPRSCRYYPTCSEYMSDAIKAHGIIKGIWLGIKRIIKCNPFFKGGYDPVPETKEIKIK